MSYQVRSKRRTIRDPKRKWDFKTWWFIILQNLKGIWTATKVLVGAGRGARKKKLGRIPKTTRIAMLGPSAKCVRCGDGWDKKNLTLDHVLPASKGGMGRRKNLQVMCEKCNQKKGCKTTRYHLPELKVSIRDRIKHKKD